MGVDLRNENRQLGQGEELHVRQVAFEVSGDQPARDTPEGKPGLGGVGLSHKQKIAREMVKAGSPAHQLSKADGEREGDEEAGRVSPCSRILWATDENFNTEQVQSVSKGTKI